MTATEKYINMNNSFCKLRDAIYESDVDEANEDPNWNRNVETSLLVLTKYLDYYKKINNVKSHVKSDTDPTPTTIIEFKRSD